LIDLRSLVHVLPAWLLPDGYSGNQADARPSCATGCPSA
jgi:hypothetical protein